MTTRTSKYVLTAMLAAVVLYLGGCAPMYVLQLCPSYVVCYVNLNTVELWQEPTNPNAMIVHHGNDLPVRMYSMNSSGAEKEVYDSLCRKHNDLHYNQYRSFPKEVNDYSVTYNCRDFLSIEVVCDKDVDEQHRAGASLCDIVRFMSWSPYKYLASGYSKYYNYKPILFLSVIVVICGVCCNFLFDFLILRFGILLAICIVGIVYRKQIFAMIMDIKGK